MTDKKLNASIVYRENLTDDLAVVRVKPDEGEVPEFEPGQFITIGLPKPVEGGGAPSGRLVRRAYSIASAPSQRGYVELYLVLVEKGKLTTRLWELGDHGRVWMDDTAKGHFTLGDAPSDADMVMVSTGTGLAPFVSMLREYRGKGRWRRFIVIHGARFAHDLGYRAELEAVSKEDASVVYIPTVTREPEGSEWKGLRGRVQAVLDEPVFSEHAGVPLDPGSSHVFLCGNPQMIEEVQTTLEGRGFVTQKKDQQGNIHFERYW